MRCSGSDAPFASPAGVLADFATAFDGSSAAEAGGSAATATAAPPSVRASPFQVDSLKGLRIAIASIGTARTASRVSLQMRALQVSPGRTPGILSCTRIFTR